MGERMPHGALLVTIGVVMGAAWWLSHPAAATY